MVCGQTEVKRRVAGLRTRLVAELVQRVLQESAATDNKLCLGVLTNQVQLVDAKNIFLNFVKKNTHGELELNLYKLTQIQSEV